MSRLVCADQCDCKQWITDFPLECFELLFTEVNGSVAVHILEHTGHVATGNGSARVDTQLGDADRSFVNEGIARHRAVQDHQLVVDKAGGARRTGRQVVAGSTLCSVGDDFARHERDDVRIDRLCGCGTDTSEYHCEQRQSCCDIDSHGCSSHV